MDDSTNLPPADYLSRKVVAIAAGEAHTLALTGKLHRHPDKKKVAFSIYKRNGIQKMDFFFYFFIFRIAGLMLGI